MLTGTFQSTAGSQFLLWASVPILSFFDQQEKFATSATCVTKLASRLSSNGAGLPEATNIDADDWKKIPGRPAGHSCF